MISMLAAFQHAEDLNVYNYKITFQIFFRFKRKVYVSADAMQQSTNQCFKRHFTSQQSHFVQTVKGFVGNNVARCAVD